MQHRVAEGRVFGEGLVLADKSAISLAPRFSEVSPQADNRLAVSTAYETIEMVSPSSSTSVTSLKRGANENSVYPCLREGPSKLIQIVDLKANRAGARASDAVEDAHDFAVRN
jgi:hypothetical protein